MYIYLHRRRGNVKRFGTPALVEGSHLLLSRSRPSALFWLLNTERTFAMFFDMYIWRDIQKIDFFYPFFKGPHHNHSKSCLPGSTPFLNHFQVSGLLHSYWLRVSFWRRIVNRKWTRTVLVGKRTSSRAGRTRKSAKLGREIIITMRKSLHLYLQRRYCTNSTDKMVSRSYLHYCTRPRFPAQCSCLHVVVVFTTFICMSRRPSSPRADWKYKTRCIAIFDRWI